MKIQCLNCGKIIEGDKKGHLISCECENNTFIDETPYYARVGGKDLKLIKEIKE